MTPLSVIRIYIPPCPHQWSHPPLGLGWTLILSCGLPCHQESTNCLVIPTTTVMLCTCAQLGRAAGSSDDSTLSVMCPSFTDVAGRLTRVATRCWVDTGIGDRRSVAMFPHGSLGNQHYPTRHAIAVLCNHLSIQGHLPAAPIPAGPLHPAGGRGGCCSG